MAVGADSGSEHGNTALASVPLLAGLEPSALEALEGLSFRRTFVPGEVILEEGRTGNGLFVVLSGAVEAFKVTAAGGTQVIARLGPGEPFGEMALLGEWKRNASVRAVEETVCLGMDRWVFLAHLQREPRLALGVIQFLVQRLAEADEQLLQR
jgi:CRP-like cAMP-binding protein